MNLKANISSRRKDGHHANYYNNKKLMPAPNNNDTARPMGIMTNKKSWSAVLLRPMQEGRDTPRQV